MTNNKGFSMIGVVAAVALLLSIVAVVPVVKSWSSSEDLGAIGTLPIENYIPAIRYNEGYYSAKAVTLTGADGDVTTGDDLTVTDDVTVSGGSVVVTTSNSATSTINVGCYQTTATSTATVIHLEFNTQATTTINGLSAGSVAWKYGACPI